MMNRLYDLPEEIQRLIFKKVYDNVVKEICDDDVEQCEICFNYGLMEECDICEILICRDCQTYCETCEIVLCRYERNVEWPPCSTCCMCQLKKMYLGLVKKND
jgi:hypothetical protein